MVLNYYIIIHGLTIRVDQNPTTCPTTPRLPNCALNFHQPCNLFPTSAGRQKPLNLLTHRELNIAELFQVSPSSSNPSPCVSTLRSLRGRKEVDGTRTMIQTHGESFVCSHSLWHWRETPQPGILTQEEGKEKGGRRCWLTKPTIFSHIINSISMICFCCNSKRQSTLWCVCERVGLMI